jgi:ribonuclease J
MIMAYKIIDDDVRISILQGFREIGGNCVVVEDEDTVVFDQGIRFSRLKKLYRQPIEPTGISELREEKVIPDLTGYEDASIFISHFHFDHLGLLWNVPPKSKIYVPEANFLKTVLSWYKDIGNWLSFIEPRFDSEVVQVYPNSRVGKVTPLNARHSSYPSYSYLYHGKNATILYTGDLRLDSLLKAVYPSLDEKVYKNSIDEYFEESGERVDILIVEGTNFSRGVTPLDSHMIVGKLQEVFEACDGAIFVSVDKTDLDSFAAFALLAKEYGRNPLILTSKLAESVDALGIENMIGVKIFQVEDVPKPIFPVELKEEALNHPKDYLFFSTPKEIVNTLRALPKSSRENIVGGTVISMLSEEPEEGSEESISDVWIRKLGLSMLKLRMSGHYYPYQLDKILDTIKPKTIIPVHTEVPETVCKIASKHGIKCALGRQDSTSATSSSFYSLFL